MQEILKFWVQYKNERYTMKKFSSFTFFLLTAVVLSNCTFVANQVVSSTELPGRHKELGLSLSLNRDSFSSGDNVIATLVLRNETDNMMTVNKRMAPNNLIIIQSDDPLGEIAFIITNPDGKVVDFNARVNMRFPREVDFAQLAPDKFIAFSYNLSTYYKPLDSLGKYSIQAIYHNEAKLDNIEPVFTGKIFSNIVYFEVDN